MAAVAAAVAPVVYTEIDHKRERIMSVWICTAYYRTVYIIVEQRR